jgi:hypothetical protein
MPLELVLGSRLAQQVYMVLGKAFGLIAMVLVCIWATSRNVDRKFLGGLDWGDNVFNWHPVLMIAALVYCTGWSLIAYKLKFLTYTARKYVHITFHVASKVCLFVGMSAVYEHKHLKAEDDDVGYLVHLTSFHSWLGLATTLLLIQNDTLGSIVFFVPSFAQRYAHIYRPLHKFLGVSAYVFAMITIFTGKFSLISYLSIKIQ